MTWNGSSLYFFSLRLAFFRYILSIMYSLSFSPAPRQKSIFLLNVKISFFYSITLFSFLFCISLPLCIHLICWTHIHIFQCSISVWNGKKDCENAMWRITFTEYENNRTKKINFLSKKENGNIEKRINRVVGLKYAYMYYIAVAIIATPAYERNGKKLPS